MFNLERAKNTAMYLPRSITTSRQMIAPACATVTGSAMRIAVRMACQDQSLKGSQPVGQRAHTFAIEETHTVSSNFLLDFRGVVAVRTDFQNVSPAFNSAELRWDITGMELLRLLPFPIWK